MNKDKPHCNKLTGDHDINMSSRSPEVSHNHIWLAQTDHYTICRVLFKLIPQIPNNTTLQNNSAIIYSLIRQKIVIFHLCYIIRLSVRIRTPQGRSSPWWGRTITHLQPIQKLLFRQLQHNRQCQAHPFLHTQSVPRLNPIL